MRAHALRELTDEELSQRLRERTDDLMAMRLQAATGVVDDYKGPREARREIARIRTIQGERERAKER